MVRFVSAAAILVVLSATNRPTVADAPSFLNLLKPSKTYSVPSSAPKETKAQKKKRTYSVAPKETKAQKKKKMSRRKNIVKKFTDVLRRGPRWLNHVAFKRTSESPSGTVAKKNKQDDSAPVLLTQKPLNATSSQASDKDPSLRDITTESHNAGTSADVSKKRKRSVSLDNADKAGDSKRFKSEEGAARAHESDEQEKDRVPDVGTGDDVSNNSAPELRSQMPLNDITTESHNAGSADVSKEMSSVDRSVLTDDDDEPTADYNTSSQAGDEERSSVDNSVLADNDDDTTASDSKGSKLSFEPEEGAIRDVASSQAGDEERSSVDNSVLADNDDDITASGSKGLKLSFESEKGAVRADAEEVWSDDQDGTRDGRALGMGGAKRNELIPVPLPSAMPVKSMLRGSSKDTSPHKNVQFAEQPDRVRWVFPPSPEEPEE